MSLNTERIYESRVIIDLLSDPDILERIREDGADMSNLICPMLPTWHWVGFYNEKTIVGCGIYHPDNMTSLRYHIHVLPQHREKWAYLCGVETLKYFVEQLTDYHKLLVEIPVMFPDTYHFTKKFGFTDEGTNRKSFMKDGVLYDQYRLGITRKEAEKWEQQQ